ncbi:Myb/SANT-like domain, harbinger transposase-derived nuclease domain protein [Tanacetum coccineum]
MEGPKKRPLVALLALMEGPKPLLAPMEGPKQRKFWSDEMIKVLLDKCIEEMNSMGMNGTSLHKQSWARYRFIKERHLCNLNHYSDLYEIVFQSISANGDGQWTNTKIGRLRQCLASTSWPSHLVHASGASAIRERVGALNMDDDPLVDVAVHVDDDDDDDDGNSRAHKINDEVRPKKKAKTSRVTMDDLMADMQSALRHIVGTTDGPTTEQCYEKLKLVGLRSTDPVFLAAFNIFGQSRQMREAWMTLPSEPDVLKGWIELTGLIMDYNQKLALIIVMFNYLRYVRSRKGKRKRDNNSAMSGRQFTLELLQGNDRQCVELLRMSRDSFIRLCTHFRVKEWLKDSKHVSVEEKMAMFLMMLGHNQRYVVIKNRFQHSTQTIHKFFHEVLAKMVVFAKEIIVPTNFNLNPTVPSHNRRLRQIFKGAVGALDGTLIHARVPINKQHLYRGRGKEGVAHDSRILSEAIRNQNASFPLPHPDKYYLCDAAYAHTRGFMAPYRNVRYWLGDFRRRRPLNGKEKFNHSHAKLRNVIERAYGVLKARFPILKRMTPFSLTTQRNITIACFALHNFIRKEGLDDELFSMYDQSNVQLNNENVLVEDDGGIEEDEVVQPQENASDRQYMTNLRDQIAQQLMQSG